MQKGRLRRALGRAHLDRVAILPLAYPSRPPLAAALAKQSPGRGLLTLQPSRYPQSAGRRSPLEGIRRISKVRKVTGRTWY